MIAVIRYRGTANKQFPGVFRGNEKRKDLRTMIKVGIIGATGYAGGELVRILMGHKDAEIVWYGSRSYVDQKYADVYRNMFQIVDAKMHG